MLQEFVSEQVEEEANADRIVQTFKMIGDSSQGLIMLDRGTMRTQIEGASIMKKYVCDACGWVYDPAVGDPLHGVKPGTPFEDIPDDWVCPECGVPKDQFSPQ